MKVHCHREGLLAAFQLAGSAVPSKDIKPILRNIKAVAEKDRCTLLATDLEIGIRLEVRGVNVEQAGEAVLPAQKTLAILREATDDEVHIEADAQACFIRGEHNEYEMGGEDPAEFPDVPAFSEDKYHEIAAGPLREMIRRTIFAAAVENPRYALTGVLWELNGDKARLIATDGRRLAVADGIASAHGGHATGNGTHVVPTKAMSLLERLLHDPEEKVLVSLRPNEALFKTERAMLYSRLVEGRYPPYKEVFPKKQPVKIPLTLAAFHSAVRQAAIMTDDESKKVIFAWAKQKLTLTARGAASGRSKVEMPLEYDGKAIEINFDPKFVTDMLRILPDDAPLTVELVDGSTVGLFRSGESYSYIVMPLS